MPHNTSNTPYEAGRWVVTSFGGPSVLKYETIPTNKITQPGPSAALLRILICGISGADNIMRAGGYTRFPQTQKPGFTPGYDCVGVIESIGDQDDTYPSRGFEVGDIVATICVIGAYATHLTVPLDECLKLKKSDDLVKMAATPLNYMTAYGMLKSSAFPATESTRSVLIGSVAGGVGTALAQVAKMLFPSIKILGTCSPSKFDFVRALGVIPIDRTLPLSDLAVQVLKITDGEGVDIAYEMVGSESSMLSFLSATNDKFGRLVAIGFIGNVKVDGSGIADKIFNPVQFAEAHSDRMTFFSVTNHYWKAQREKFRTDYEEVIVPAVRDGRLKPVIGPLFQLKDAVRINEMLSTGEGVVGKLEMLVDEDVWNQYGVEN